MAEQKAHDHVPFVFVTGLIRSGTTWIGKLLASSPRALYIHEPFNPDSLWNQAIPTPVAHLYLNDVNGGPWLHPFRRILRIDPALRGDSRRRAGSRIEEFVANNEKIRGPRSSLTPVVKDPTALFLVEWIVHNFGTRPVIILRHPVSIAKSLLRLRWALFNPSHFLNQPLLLERFFDETEVEQLEALRRGPELDDPARAALTVAWLYKAIALYRREYPHWIYVSYEDFLQEPLANAERLFEATGLPFSKAAREALSTRGEGEYQPEAAHQTTLKPIGVKAADIFAPSEQVSDWRAIHEEYFGEAERALAGLVRWS